MSLYSNVRTTGVFGFLLLLVLLSCAENDQRKSFSNPKAYNDYIMTELHRMDRWYNDQMSVVKDAPSARKFCVYLEKHTGIGLIHLNIQPFDGDSSLCEGTKALFTYLHRIAKNELLEFFNLVYEKKPNSEVQKRLADLTAQIDGEYSRCWTAIGMEQKLFASNHNLQIKNLTH